MSAAATALHARRFTDKRLPGRLGAVCRSGSAPVVRPREAIPYRRGVPGLDGPPMTMLEAAYGVPKDDLTALVDAIVRRVLGSTAPLASVRDGVPAEWKATSTIVTMLVLNTQDFARVRGGGRPSRPLRKSMTTMTSTYVPAESAPEFVERVLADIASTLDAHRNQS